MTARNLRTQIEQNLSQISADNLQVIAEFVEFIKKKQEATQMSLEDTIYQPASGRSISSGRSILRHAGTWVGDDLEDCLQLMSETRGRLKINHRLNPFE